MIVKMNDLLDTKLSCVITSHLQVSKERLSREITS